jgi:hypothetical protein
MRKVFVLLKLNHCADDLLDWHLPINAMTVVQVDGLDIHPLQALFATLEDILWIGAFLQFAIGEGEAEFTSQENALALSGVLFDPCADNVFAVELMPCQSRYWSGPERSNNVCDHEIGISVSS